MIGAWQAPSLPFHAAVGAVGAALALIGFGIIFWSIFARAKKEAIVTGDNFNNFGNNFGHMGPINNYGKSDFQLTDDAIQEAIRACPSGIPVLIHAVGPQSAIQMADTLQAAMINAGFTVNVTSSMMTMPPPEHPFRLVKNPTLSVITIAPKA